ncbi:hypothetical protein HGRIS_007895 [Hohenbuehelia grisea]
MLPLLDHFQEDTLKITATDLFAFQGSQTRTSGKPSLPSYIRAWPTLPSNLLEASIAPYNLKPAQESTQGTNDIDTSNHGSILIVADNAGHVYSFLEGSYPLGTISVEPCSVISLSKFNGRMSFSAHLEPASEKSIELYPTTISMPILDGRYVRDFARCSSTARELLWYISRVVKEMRACWFGSESTSGARELGQKWVRALEAKQTGDFGEDEPTAILDLTCLLLTGRITEPLSDLFGSGEQMSERGIQKWESTVTDALSKLRDYAEKRIALACQRMHLVMEEIKGWSRIPEFKAFNLNTLEVNEILLVCERGIMISGWLAAVARRELFRFKEFIAWLRFEVSALNPSNDGTTPPARYDVLEVNNYFMSGLVVSSIDKWFIGPVPQFPIGSVGIPVKQKPLSEVLQRAKQAANDTSQLAWQQNITQKDLNHVDRNLDALVQDLGSRCQKLFSQATTATSQSVVVTRHQPAVVQPEYEKPVLDSRVNIREWRVQGSEGMREYLAMFCTLPEGPCFCLAKLLHGNEASPHPLSFHVVLFECSLAAEDSVQLELLEAEFFDDDYIVLIYRLRNEDGSTFIATVNYNELGYQELHPEWYVTREDLMLGALSAWRAGQLLPARLPINRCRRLAPSITTPVSLAVNGRAGRRVACILDGKGLIMESLDMEGDGEDIEATGEEGDEEGGVAS